ncbi:MAG: response regulator [Clostridium fessum]
MQNILLIEDEENLNRGISLKLKKEGYTVFSASTVTEGLYIFHNNKIDLVICDIGLPQRNWPWAVCSTLLQKK